MPLHCIIFPWSSVVGIGLSWVPSSILEADSGARTSKNSKQKVMNEICWYVIGIRVICRLYAIVELVKLFPLRSISISYWEKYLRVRLYFQ